MKCLYMLLFALLVSFHSFAVIGAINGNGAVCIGTYNTLTDATSGGTWSSSNTAVATIGTSGQVYGVAAGTSVITYTMGGTATLTVTVSADPAATIHALPGTTLCAGQPDTLYATFTGCTSSSAYQWFIDGTHLTSGDTAVFVPSSGDAMSFRFTAVSTCNGTSSSYTSDTITITVNPLPGLTLSGQDSFCMGAVDTLFAHTVYNSHLTWTPSLDLSCMVCDTVYCMLPTGAQVYTVVATTVTGSCTESATFRVSVNPLPVTSVSPAPVSVCPDSTVLLTASGADTYFWWPGIGIACTTCNPTTLTGSISFVLYMTGTTALGCSDSTIVPVSIGTGCPEAIPTVSNINELTIFPNPAYNELNIQSTIEPITKITITNVLGQTVYIQSANSQLLTVNVANLPSGVYFVQVNLAYRQAGDAEVRKFVKE